MTIIININNKRCLNSIVSKPNYSLGRCNMSSVFDPKVQELNPSSKIVVALERISEAFKVSLWNENKKYNLSPIQLQILTFLLFHDEKIRTLSNIAKEFHTTKSSISDSIKALENKNYIVREKNSSDFRISTITLTPEGLSIAKDVSSFANRIESIVDGFSGTKKEILMDSLLEIIHKLYTDGLISIQRMCLNCKYHEFIPEDNLYKCSLLNEYMRTSDLRIDCNSYN